uniref:Uncharacterized protein n=1 Tax=Solanum tuberosum TaxID=4113 RepID=M1BQS3_SOLTU
MNTSPERITQIHFKQEHKSITAKTQTKLKSLRHPRKDRSSICSQAWRRRKHLGGHCECFEKQALGSIITGKRQEVHEGNR